jgi:hypothetical protein
MTGAALILAVSLTGVMQAPNSAATKANPKPNAKAAESIVLRNPQAGGWVMFFFDPTFLTELDLVMAKRDDAKVNEFMDARKAKNEWKPIPSYVPAKLREEKTVRGKRGDIVLYNVEIADGPDNGAVGWVAKTMVVRADQNGSVERKLDLERAVAKKKAREAQAALARAKKKASEIKDEKEREAYLKKMAPVWEAQSRENQRMAMEAQAMQIQAANAEGLRRAAMGLQGSGGGVRSGVPMIYGGSPY